MRSRRTSTSPRPAPSARSAKDERIEAERLKQEEARLRRERAKLAAFLQGKALNAEMPRSRATSKYGGKIKRICVTADQLKALNTGELGVVQFNGRYLLVCRRAGRSRAIFLQAVALKVDPDAPIENDPYADPKMQCPTTWCDDGFPRPF